jgi:hypothetical protein
VVSVRAPAVRIKVAAIFRNHPAIRQLHIEGSRKVCLA